jgi:hypothetical protein
MTVNESLQDRIIRTLIGLTVTVGGASNPGNHRADHDTIPFNRHAF